MCYVVHKEKQVMTIFQRLVAGAVLLAVLSGLMQSQTLKNAPVVVGEKIRIRSKVLNEEREIWIWLPEEYSKGEAKYPVLYLLDGEWHFQHVTGLIHFLSWERVGRIPKMIVAAVVNTSRSRDFSPAPWPGYEYYTGGGDHFVTFLERELIPAVQREFRVSSQKILAGHSLAGTFALYAFLTHPDLFDAYLTLSPCLFWHERFMLKKARELIEKKDRLDKKLYIAHEYSEGEPAATMREFEIMLEQQAPSKLQWESIFMKGDDHFSYILKAFTEGLEFVFANTEDTSVY